jgi:hypothetical protein
VLLRPGWLLLAGVSPSKNTLMHSPDIPCSAGSDCVADAHGSLVESLRAMEHQRDTLMDWVPHPALPGRWMRSWVLNETRAAHAVINRYREKQGLSPIDIQRALLLEEMASAHNDYGVKFAQYCAEETRRRP